MKKISIFIISVLALFAAGGCSKADNRIPVESVVLQQTNITLTEGDNPVTLEYKIYPENATDKTITWEVFNPIIVSVNNGTVTPLTVGQTAVVVITNDGSKTASCSVNVVARGNPNPDPNLDPNANPNGNPNTNPPDMEVDQYLPQDDPTSQVTIKFWTSLSDDSGSALRNIVDEFNETYYGKYKVEVEKLANNLDALNDTIKPKIAAGEVPALCMGYPDSFSEYITNSVNRSSLLRLNNFISDSEFGYTDQELSDFVDSYYMEGKSYQFEGVWSMPMCQSTDIMFYNYSYFMGVSDVNAALLGDDDTFMDLYNNATGMGTVATESTLLAIKNYATAHGGKVYELPTTWEEMIAVARQMMADRAAIPALAGSTFFPVAYDNDANLMITQMKQRDIAYTVNDAASQEDPAKHFQFNNTDAKELAGELAELVEDKVLITRGSLGGNMYTSTYFNAAQAAMAIGCPGGNKYLISTNFVVKTAPVPHSGSTPYYIQRGPSICFFNNENPYIHKGAWLFYKMLAETNNNLALALENLYNPIKKSCYSSQTFQDWIAMAGQGLKYDIPAQNYNLNVNGCFMTPPVFVGSGTARYEIGRILARHYLNYMTIDQAFEQAYNACVQAASH